MSSEQASLESIIRVTRVGDFVSELFYKAAYMSLRLIYEIDKIFYFKRLIGCVRLGSFFRVCSHSTACIVIQNIVMFDGTHLVQTS